MSSIRIVQTERLLQDTVRTLYSSGTQPMLNDITTRISQYFSKYPAGRPLPMPLRDMLDGMVSDHKKYNTLLKHVAVNIDVLYEASLRQVEDVLMLTASMQTDLERLEHKRKRIELKIDDFLLSQYNTDGYFYSSSDNFTDTELTNLYLTTAQIDTDVGAVMLPTLSSTTSRLPKQWVSKPSISVHVGGSLVEYDELAPFTGALEDSLENIVWAFEVETNEPQEVIAEVEVRLLHDADPVSISRIDIKPYGATPVQVFFETRSNETLSNWQGFGSKIQKGTTKMVFGDSTRQITDLKLTLRKTEPDYTENKNNSLIYKYIFGARELAFIYQVYERSARYVSIPLVMPADYANDLTIDAVSIDVDADVPGDCELKYFVAPSDFSEFDPELSPGEPELEDYVWTEIIPIDSNEPGHKIIRFDGAATSTRMIRENPAVGDIQLEPPSDSGPVQERNPTPSIISGVDVYRIAPIQDDPFRNSISLLEGVNTTRIYSKNIDQSISFKEIDLDYWGNIFDNEDTTLDFGRIDTGNEFFYGGDVGAVGRDVYIETFLHAEQSWSTFLAEFQKVDVRSQTWDIDIYLNGRPLGHLPPGTHKMQLPWNFNRGLNHVVVLVRIPMTAGPSDPYMGAVSLLGRGHLNDYGPVHLAKWEYTDLFTMKYNESGQPRTFTIHDGYLISRRQPTTNYQLRYSVDTGLGPVGVLVRAELSRTRNNPNVTPELKQYRLRYSYAEER